MVNANAKGKRGELEAAKLVASLLAYPDCARSAQSCGKWAADLHMTGVLHFEVKRVKKLPVQTNQYMAQAVDDSANTGHLPIVMMRADNGEWLVMLRFDDLPRLAAELQHINQEIK